jgi:hypothetical protein
MNVHMHTQLQLIRTKYIKKHVQRETPYYALYSMNCIICNVFYALHVMSFENFETRWSPTDGHCPK